jgi:hypothetical protein
MVSNLALPYQDKASIRSSGEAHAHFLLSGGRFRRLWPLVLFVHNRGPVSRGQLGAASVWMRRG